MKPIRLEDSWLRLLNDEWDKVYFSTLCQHIRTEYQQHIVYPRGAHIFRALDLCPVDRVKVVILGQDPYHGHGQAEGLSFSVPDGIAVPPSLRNIKQEIYSDLGQPSVISHGHLMPWVEQGVLLLNSILTVRAGEAGSHRGLGWEHFTDTLIMRLAQARSGLVFMLWGSYAQRKGSMIDRSRHLVLEAGHPSPLSARHFFGCKHFSQANDYLRAQGLSAIYW